MVTFRSEANIGQGNSTSKPRATNSFTLSTKFLSVHKVEGKSKVSEKSSKIDFFGPSAMKIAELDTESAHSIVRLSDTSLPPVAARTFKLPAEIWGSIFRHVPLPPINKKSVGDLTALRLTCIMFTAETLHVHQEFIDRVASGAAQAFLRGARDRPTTDEVELLVQARALTLRTSEVSESICLG